MRCLRFGLVNPSKLLPNYLIEIKQADSSFFADLLNTKNLLDTLKLEQVQHQDYLFLQKALGKLTTSSFKLKKPIPIFITYFTAWRHHDKIAYAKDIYGIDQQLWNTMNDIDK